MFKLIVKAMNVDGITQMNSYRMKKAGGQRKQHSGVGGWEPVVKKTEK